MGKKKEGIRAMGDAPINKMLGKGKGFKTASKKSQGEWSGPDLEGNEMFKPGKGFSR